MDLKANHVWQRLIFLKQFLQGTGQEVLSFISNQSSKLFPLSANKCLWLLEDYYLSAFVPLYSQAVTTQKQCSMVMDILCVTVQYQHC